MSIVFMISKTGGGEPEEEKELIERKEKQKKKKRKGNHPKEGSKLNLNQDYSSSPVFPNRSLGFTIHGEILLM